MPSSMPHLIIAKKVNPSAPIEFYAGTLAPDSIRERIEKEKVHYINVADREAALKEFAQNASNEYLKGFLLHLYVDWKFNNTLLSDFINKTGENWFSQYREEISKMTAYAFHNTEWAFNLHEQLENWDLNGFTETEFITTETFKAWISRSKKWQMENKLEPSSAFPPPVIEEFTASTAQDFTKWFLCNSASA